MVGLDEQDESVDEVDGGEREACARDHFDGGGASAAGGFAGEHGVGYAGEEQRDEGGPECLGGEVVLVAIGGVLGEVSARGDEVEE